MTYSWQLREKYTYLFVKLDKSWLKLILDVLSEVVWVLVVRVRFACIVLLRRGQVHWLLRHSVQRHVCILRIAHLVKFHVRDLLVAHNSWVMSHDVTWKLWELRCHTTK